MATATLNGNGTERHAAAARWRASVEAGEPLTGRQLADEFDRSPRWGREVIAEARDEDGAAEDASAPARPAWFDTGWAWVVGLVAMAASYGHMYQVARFAGEPVWAAAAWPLTVDGLAIVALRRSETGRWWLLVALAVSVASNVLSKYPEIVATVAPAVSGWPPVALYGIHRMLHRRLS